MVHATLREDDFEQLYQVLQTEDPIYFDWLDGHHLRLVTSEEWPGEGHDDVPGFGPRSCAARSPGAHDDHQSR